MLIEGGNVETRARMEVLTEFILEPKGARKSMDDIYAARGITDSYMKSLCSREAETMAQERFMHCGEDGSYVFSRDENGSYFWKKATIKDWFAHYIAALKR